MTFLRNCWYMAMWAQDLAPGALVPRRLLDEPLVFYRDADGSVRALIDACPHRYAPLSLGKILPNGHLQCGYHGLEFDGTGACVRNPHASGRIPANASVKAYEVVEKHTALWIWMGDKPADPELIPDFSLLDTSDPAIVSKRDWMRMDANYMLINENLLDLSHATVLHGGILGNDEMIPAKIDVRQDGRRVHVSRWMPGVPAPALYDQLFNRDGGTVDIWADMRFDIPGCFLNDTGATNPGAERQAGTGVFGTHFLTPETESTTLYHFAAVRQNPRSWGEPVDSELRVILTELRRRAFEDEDKRMIDAQQRNFDDPAIDKSKRVVLEVDAGPMRCRRMMEELIAAEAGA